MLSTSDQGEPPMSLSGDDGRGSIATQDATKQDTKVTIFEVDVTWRFWLTAPLYWFSISHLASIALLSSTVRKSQENLARKCRNFYMHCVDFGDFSTGGLRAR